MIKNETSKTRQLFLFWQFNGDNSSWCNQTCPYCYGGKKKMKHYWNGDIDRWEKAFERLNRDIYFVMSYGETMGGHGFYECVDMIGRHPTWTLCIVTNLSYSPERLLSSRLAKEKRLFMIPCWHPLGVPDRIKGWETFKKHLLMLKDAEIPTHVLYLWYAPQIKWFPEYFDWLDSHDIRVGVRRYLGNIGGHKILIPHNHKVLFSFGGKNYPQDYTDTEHGFLYAVTSPKVIKYGIECESTKGKLCSASKDMMLVTHDGQVALCADCCGYIFGNIFDSDFKLRTDMIHCPTKVCGGDYGMLHMIDQRFGELPSRLWNDTFVSQVEENPQTIAVVYPKRTEMINWLKQLRCKKPLS